MKREELERHLRRLGCFFVRHGGGHDIWRNATGGKQASVPRHRAIAEGTVRAICRQLGVALP